MSEREEFRGDDCVVLPGDYLNSVEAVADIYSDELAVVANNFNVDQLSRRRRFLRRALLVPVIWALSAIWTVCA